MTKVYTHTFDYMEGWVIRIVEQADGKPSDFAGAYVKEYNASPPDLPLDTCYLDVTDDIQQAKVYPTFQAAMDHYQAVDTRSPVRKWDGRPNRPLTAYTVKISHVRLRYYAVEQARA